MSDLRCSCGKHNPNGTALCGACGNPLEEKGKKQTILNMRYEGAARRSQTYSRTFIDHIWNFFSSVKVGIGIIIVLLVVSSLGTILPQEMYIPPTVNPADHYQDEYGLLGKIYYLLGLHNLYQSWWYLLIMASLVVSLIIASVDRFFPLYRSLKNQRVSKHIHFLKRQRLVSESRVSGLIADENLLRQLKEKKYKVRTEANAILAEKGRFSRWGPYVNHIGLIIFLIGGMLRFFPGMFVDEQLWIREGETEVIPGTDGEYYLENHQFLMELYDEDDEVYKNAIEGLGGEVVETFESMVTLYKRKEDGPAGSISELEAIDTYNIQVNNPFKFDRHALYQVSYKLNELNKMRFILENEESGNEIGEFTVDLINPEGQYALANGYSVALNDYFPNFYMNEGTLGTQSRIPDNPAFVFQVDIPNQKESEVSFLSIGQNFDPEEDNEYRIRLSGLETKHVTGLTVRRDYTLPFLIVGGVIFMIGLIQGSYWTHRRIWILQEEGLVILAAHTNKNWYAFQREVIQLTETAGLEQPKDRTLNKPFAKGGE